MVSLSVSLRYRVRMANQEGLGLYISDLENRSLEDDFMALLFGRPIELHCVKKSSTSKNVLEMDVARAWKESEQRAGWSNEVAVEVFIR